MKKIKINILKIKELSIATDIFSVFDDSKLSDLDYNKWKEFIESNSSYFIWYSDTESGKKFKNTIEKMSPEKRKMYQGLLEKYHCNAEYSEKKRHYLVNVTFYDELKYITIRFERRLKVDDIKLYYNMAKHIDAKLLYNGKTIIDENVIEELENDTITQKMGGAKT